MNKLFTLNVARAAAPTGASVPGAYAACGEPAATPIARRGNGTDSERRPGIAALCTEPRRPPRALRSTPGTAHRKTVPATPCAVATVPGKFCPAKPGLKRGVRPALDAAHTAKRCPPLPAQTSRCDAIRAGRSSRSHRNPGRRRPCAGQDRSSSNERHSFHAAGGFSPALPGRATGFRRDEEHDL